MTTSLRLAAGRATCDVDPDAGARIVSLSVDGRELLVTDGPDPLARGCYPMAPYAGRVRDAQLLFEGRRHHLRRNAQPHSIHGTVFDRRWTVDSTGPTSLVMSTDLGPHWPFAGTVTQRFTLHPDHLALELELRADERMPAQVGWHPCFVKPTAAHLRFEHMIERDERGIATADRVRHEPVDVDDCFEDVSTPDGRLGLSVNGVDVSLSSDCRHWVVYDRPTHSTCVEPQSGPPNGVNACPDIVEAGGSLRRFLTIAWT